jgi:dihydropteroate synthase
VVKEVAAYLQQRCIACIESGIHRNNIVIDPGFGFGKTLRHNLDLLNRLESVSELELPVLVGISRKSMLGAILDKPAAERLYAGIAAAVIAYNKGARLFRVHDVAPTRDALVVCDALQHS